MTERILTADGLLEPHPWFTEKVCLKTGTAQILIAKGDNGYWYIRIENLEDVSEQLCHERFEPVKRFHNFIMTVGLEARKYWNQRLGQKFQQHVHFTTTQSGYEGTWAIYDLGQAFAAHVDQHFAARIHAVYRQYEQGIYHDDEQPSLPAANATISLAHIAQFGLAINQLAEQAIAHGQEFQFVKRELGAIRTVAEQAANLARQTFETADYTTIERYIEKKGLTRQLPPGHPQAQYGRWLTGYCVQQGIQVRTISLTGRPYEQVSTYPSSVIDATLPGYLRDIGGQGQFNFPV